MLTTVDNPFNPYTDWAAWLAYDIRLGHGTCAYLARIVVTSDELSISDQERDIDAAIKEILKHDESNLYVIAVDPNSTK